MMYREMWAVALAGSANIARGAGEDNGRWPHGGPGRLHVCWLGITPLPMSLTTRCSRHGTALAPALTCALWACIAPSDQSDRVLVTIEAPSDLVIQGRTMLLSAHAWQVDGAGGRRELSGVAVEWGSENPDVAIVLRRSDSTALVTPVRPGTVRIYALAIAFEDAAPASVDLRVANAVTIDSVRPTVVHYGDQVTVYGIGLGDITRVSLGQGDLLPDSASFLGQPEGAGQINLWVPFPAATSPLVVTSRVGTTTAAPDTTEVHPKDLYHELELPPPTIELGGPTSRAPDTLFYNPALALVEGEPFDLLHFHRAAAGSLTFSFSSVGPALTLFNPVLTADREVPLTFQAGFRSWAIGFADQYCHGHRVVLGRPVGINAPVKLVRALKNVDLTDLQVAVYGEPSGPYRVTVQDGYVTADPRIVADRFEENDSCEGADASDADPSRRIEPPFADTLTIDNPYDVDWFRFRTAGSIEDAGPPVLVTIRVAARPFAARDSSDIGLVLASPEVFDSSRMPGSSERLTAALSPGTDYYLIVLDDGGIATRYSLCIAFGSTCQFLDERPATLIRSAADDHGRGASRWVNSTPRTR